MKIEDMSDGAKVFRDIMLYIAYNHNMQMISFNQFSILIDLCNVSDEELEAIMREADEKTEKIKAKMSKMIKESTKNEIQ